jgi:uncharacterized protein YbbK (DUF523 family)
MKTDKIKNLCASIANHEDWAALQTYLLMTAQPSCGIDTARDIFNRINTIGEDTPTQFKKTKKPTIHVEENAISDPDLQDL